MNFDEPDVVESICYQMRMAEYPRGRNRALINNLFNGLPPYTEAEEESNNIQINVNFLEGTRLSHDVRSQFYQSIMKPGNYFNATTDAGPVHKRQKWSNIVTKEMNRIMKRSMFYSETIQSKIAMNVLHGIAPCGWEDNEMWCPTAIGVEDVFVPANTLRSTKNLPFFAIYRSLTAPELLKLVNSPRRDPGWNMKMVKAAIKWVDQESKLLMNNNWPEIWAPEKHSERIKGDGGYYFGDQVPTINVFDFYFWNNSGKIAGWNRRMILDGWSMPELQGGVVNSFRKTDKFHAGFRRQFMYNPGDRKEAFDRNEIINWQFADLSAVAPFKYHSVRSLGYLLYSICHLQNRLRCKVSEAVFEQLMILFRVASEQDYQRALKVDLVNRGFVDDSIKFMSPAERYQVNTELAQFGLMSNQQIINQNSSSYTVQPQSQSQTRERTKFEVMAEVNAMTSLVSSALQQVYMYQTPEYREIFRRMIIKGSRDAESRKFQDACLKQGVNEKVLYNLDCWDLEPQRVLGAGNKTLELAIAEQLMQYRNLFDPEPQRQILREFAMATTDDAAKAEMLVPENPVKITDSVHDAQLAAGTLMQGLPVALKTGMNHIEYVDTLMATLATLIQQYRTSGQIPEEKELQGMMNMSQHIQQHIQIIAQDKGEQQRVKKYGDAMGKMDNVLKGFAQQLAEKMQAEAQQGQQLDPETQAKIISMEKLAEAKIQNTKTAHAQRTAQRQVQFEMEQQRKNDETQANIQRQDVEAKNQMRIESAQARLEMELESRKTEHEIEVDRIREEKKPKQKKVDSGKG